MMWLISKLESSCILMDMAEDLITEAKAIEKQQIVEFAEQYESYSWKASNDNRYKPRMTAAEYFESTFKTKEGK